MKDTLSQETVTTATASQKSDDQEYYALRYSIDRRVSKDEDTDNDSIIPFEIFQSSEFGDDLSDDSEFHDSTTFCFQFVVDPKDETTIPLIMKKESSDETINERDSNATITVASEPAAEGREQRPTSRHKSPPRRHTEQSRRGRKDKSPQGGRVSRRARSQGTKSRRSARGSSRSPRSSSTAPLRRSQTAEVLPSSKKQRQLRRTKTTDTPILAAPEGQGTKDTAPPKPQRQKSKSKSQNGNSSTRKKGGEGDQSGSCPSTRRIPRPERIRARENSTGDASTSSSTRSKTTKKDQQRHSDTTLMEDTTARTSSSSPTRKSHPSGGRRNRQRPRGLDDSLASISHHSSATGGTSSKVVRRGLPRQESCLDDSTLSFASHTSTSTSGRVRIQRSEMIRNGSGGSNSSSSRNGSSQLRRSSTIDNASFSSEERRAANRRSRSERGLLQTPRGGGAAMEDDQSVRDQQESPIQPAEATTPRGQFSRQRSRRSLSAKSLSPAALCHHEGCRLVRKCKLRSDDVLRTQLSQTIHNTTIIEERSKELALSSGSFSPSDEEEDDHQPPTMPDLSCTEHTKTSSLVGAMTMIPFSMVQAAKSTTNALRSSIIIPTMSLDITMRRSAASVEAADHHNNED